MCDWTAWDKILQSVADISCRKVCLERRCYKTFQTPLQCQPSITVPKSSITSRGSDGNTPYHHSQSRKHGRGILNLFLDSSSHITEKLRNKAQYTLYPKDAKSRPGHRFRTGGLWAVKLPAQVWWADVLSDNACAQIGGWQKLQIIPNRQFGCRYLVLKAARV